MEINQNRKAPGDSLANEITLRGRDREVVIGFLQSRGITSLSGISLQTMVEYRRFIAASYAEKAEKDHFGALLETVICTGLSQPLIHEIDDKRMMPRAVGNKVKAFLMSAGVHTTGDITYGIRKMFDTYLQETGLVKRREYVKALDRLKLNAIRRGQEHNPTEKPRLSYRNRLLYLGYHPDYETAMEFYYVRDKEELVFDFSMKAPERMKHQIFKMLVHSLEIERDRKARRESYLVPLKKLYLFCAEWGIADIELMQADMIEAFRCSMEGKVGTKAGIYMRIVDITRKYLFMSSKEIHWHANVWYTDRLRMRASQGNPANHVERIRFLQIRDRDNLEAFKNYIRFLICARHCGMLTVRSRYYVTAQFLLYCEAHGIRVSDISPEQIREYFLLEEREKKTSTMNQTVDVLYTFLQFANDNELDERVIMEMSYFKKADRVSLHNRTIDPEAHREFLKAVDLFPEELRLMCLNLCLTGIRVNELCAIKGGAYSYDGDSSWLTVMQFKVSSENTVPIPLELYRQMKDYIARNGIGAEEYVFRNRTGGAYDAATFRKQVQALCKERVPGYVFRPHELRHARATYLYGQGIPTDQVSKLLGHRDKDTTGRYISISSDQIDEANKKYFREVCGDGRAAAKRRGRREEADEHGEKRDVYCR